MTIKKKFLNDYDYEDDEEQATHKRNQQRLRRPVRNLKKFWNEHSDPDEYDEYEDIIKR